MSISKAKLIAAVPPFDDCSADELERVVALADVQDLAVGTTLMTQGEPGSETVIVAEGWLSIMRNGAVIAERGPGKVIGEMALLSSRPRSATVVAASDCRLVVIAREGFSTLMGEMPVFRERVKASLSRRARGL